MYAMDARMYDPAIARWVVQDPVTHHSMSPYNAFDNNPIYWADPSGADSVGGNKDGVVYGGGHWSDGIRGVKRDNDSNDDNGNASGSTALGYAKLSKHSYGEGGDTGDYQLVGSPYESEEGTGFKAALYKNGSMYVLAIAGTEDFMKDGKADAAQIFGISTQYAEGLSLAKTLLRRPEIKGHLTVTGHSLGGGIAEYIAMNTGIHAVTFNAAGVSALTSGIHRNSNTDAYILTTDPLNKLQRASYFLPSAGGRIHYLSPDLNIGSYLNGHSIDHVIEALTPNHYIHDISRAFFRAASRLKF